MITWNYHSNQIHGIVCTDFKKVEPLVFKQMQPIRQQRLSQNPSQRDHGYISDNTIKQFAKKTTIFLI